MKPLFAGVLVLCSLCAFAGGPKNLDDYNIYFTIVRGGQQDYDDYQPGVDIGSVHTSGGSVPTKFCWLHVSDGKTLYSINMKKQGLFARDCPDFEIGQSVRGTYQGRHLWLLVRDKHGKMKKSIEYTIMEKGNAKTLQ